MADALASRGLAGRSLRRHAARGSIINGAFTVGLNTLGLLRGFVVAAFLDASDFGVWGILVIAVGGLFWFKEVGISEKFVQQSDADQELAFQKAFTLEAIFTTIFMGIVILAVPLVALAYGRPELLAPALVITLAVPAVVFQSPLWVFYRSMDFARQRTLQALDPVIGFVVTVVLAIAGLGYWSLVLGTVAGAWAAAAGALSASPYPLRWRYDRGTMREYVRFSWPLFCGNGARFIVAQSGLLIASRSLTIAAVGFITLASQISNYTNRVDQILAQTLYPAICAVRDRVDLLFESFVKSNRLALMWGVPFGLGMTLFSADLVHFVLGDRWRGAVGLMQVFGVLAAANHLAYNWDQYFRARGDTKPIATWAAFNLVATLALTVPLMLWLGLDGYAIGMAAATAVSLAGRFYFLGRLFPGFGVARHVIRSIAPTIPAVGAVLLVRLLVGGEDTLVRALGEMALFGVVTIAATALLERSLLREAIGYLRRSAPVEPRVA